MYELAPHVFACATGRHCMFLDLMGDRYLSVPRDQLDELAPQIRNWQLPEYPPAPRAPFTERAEIAQELLAAGILVRCNEPATPGQSNSQPIPLARASVLNGKTPRTTLKSQSWLTIFAALFWADFALRSLSLLRIVKRISKITTSTRGSRTSHSPANAATFTAGFLNARPWYPHDYLCLFDSLALVRYLATQGINARWVFGVREDPFAAHCWVQHGDLILNDHLDRVKTYAPIMIV